MGNSFNDKAATWDENPRRLQLVEKVGAILEKQLELDPSKNILDYGCGTGLLGYKFIKRASRITFCDTSEGMLEQVLKKRDFYGYKNVKTQLADYTKDSIPDESYNLIVSMLVLHHVEELDKLLSVFSTLLNKNGEFCWIDLDKEDGSFHDDNTGIHHFGFSQEEINELLLKNGFQLKYYSNELHIKKEIEGEEKNFPLFICIARKA